MTRTTLRATTSGQHGRRTAAPGMAESALTQAHWCATRLIYHGWRFAHLGRGSLTAVTPQGHTVRVRHTGGPDHRNLHNDLCAALMSLGEGLASTAAHLEIMLRLQVPITGPPSGLHPWTIPGSAGESEAVRIGYWLSTILIDDYRWRILDVEASGFQAVTAYRDDPQRYTATPSRRGSRTPTTSMLLAAHLATLSDTERRALTRLISAHQWMPQCAHPAASPDLPGQTWVIR